MTKQASEIKVGDKVCESSGFMWEVTAIRSTAKYATMNLSPVYQTMLGEKDCEVRVKLTSIVQVA
ncbi:hypothetical protein EB077_10235 [bacterium]|nr:hypothetical protein [bacterium]NDG19497.1 hypothetical protein [Betaproteobacteria bacterium]